MQFRFVKCRSNPREINSVYLCLLEVNAVNLMKPYTVRMEIEAKAVPMEIDTD